MAGGRSPRRLSGDDSGLDLIGAALLSITGRGDQLRMQCLLAYVKSDTFAAAIPTPQGCALHCRGQAHATGRSGSRRCSVSRATTLCSAQALASVQRSLYDRSRRAPHSLEKRLKRSAGLRQARPAAGITACGLIRSENSSSTSHNTTSSPTQSGSASSTMPENKHAHRTYRKTRPVVGR